MYEAPRRAVIPLNLEETLWRRAKLGEVDGARELFEGAFTTGELDGGIKEQSLVLRTPQGLVMITGCARPGPTKIVRKA